MNNSLTTAKKSTLYEMPILLLAFFALYALTSSQNLSAAYDSIQLIYDIDHGDLYSPHHLIYRWFAAKWVSLWRWLGSDADSAWVVQLLNAVFAAMSLTIFYLILRFRIHLRRWPAMIGTTLPAFSFGFWFYATVVEVYIIPLFFLLLSVYIISCKRPSIRAIIFVGITHGIAILFHQMNALFLPVVFYALLTRRNTPPSIPKRISYYLTAIIPTVAIPYLFVILQVQKLKSISGIWYWLTYYTHVENYWSDLNPALFIKAAIGFSRTIIGGHFVLAANGFQNIASKATGGKRLLDESFLVRDLSETTAYILAALSTIAVCFLIAVTCRKFRFWRQIWKEHHIILGISLIWIGIYSTFFLFWFTASIEFWIPQSVIFWLIIIIIWQHPQDYKRTINKHTIGLLVIAALLLVINFTSSIQWLMKKDYDYYYVRTSQLANRAEPGDLIIIGRWWILEHYLDRFTNADILPLSTVYSDTQSQNTINIINTAINTTRDNGKKVLLSGEAVNPEQETIDMFGEEYKDFVDQLWIPYQDNWLPTPSNIDTIYILDQH